MATDIKWPYRPLPNPNDPTKLSPQERMWKAMGPQSPYTYVGFGGPRGGGKSYGMRSFLVTACWQNVLHACIIRRTRRDLLDNHINPVKSELRPFIEAKYVRFNERDAALYFKNGSILSFLYCDKHEDLEHIQGQAYDLMGIEESTQFDEHYIHVMTSSCRVSTIASSAGTKYPNKILQTFNWGGQSHQYHRRVFWDSEFDKNEKPENYFFIFAPMEMNTVLMENTPHYKQQLMKLSKQYRRAWIKGDPDAFTGEVFKIVDTFHVVDQDKILKPFDGKIPDTWQIIGSLDAATGDYCSFGLYAKTPSGHMYKILTYYQKDLGVQEHIENIIERIFDCPYTDGRTPSYILADRHAFQKRYRHSVIATDITWSDIFRDYGLTLRKANDDRISGSHALQFALDYKYDYSIDKLVKKPKLQFFKDTDFTSNTATIRELRSIQRNVNNPEDIDQSGADHAYDETRYFVMGAVTPREHINRETTVEVNKNEDYGRNKSIDELIGSTEKKRGFQKWYG